MRSSVHRAAMEPVGSVGLACLAGAVALAVSGCYRPELPCSVRCGADGACPEGTACQPGGFCAAEGSACLEQVRLTFDNAGGEALSDFPVLVRLDPSRIDYGRAPTGGHLVFTDPDGTALPAETDTWTPGGTSAVWVRVPRIDADSTTDHIFMSYAAEAGPPPPGAGVWDGGFAAVWHLGDADGEGLLPDSTGNGHPGAPTAVEVLSAGAIGGARAFLRSGDHRVEPAASGGLFDAWPAFALELWIRPDYGDDAAWEALGEDQVLDKGGPIRLGRVRRDGPEPAGFGSLQIDVEFQTGGSFHEIVYIPDRRWSYVVYAHDGAAYRTYVDGAVDAEHALPGDALIAGALPLTLGDHAGALNGAIDEVRISSAPRSPGWIAAQHRVMTDAFVTFTPEGGEGGGAPGDP